jgi:hypothetical protein
LYLARKKNNGPNLFIFVQPNFYFIFYKVVKTGPIEPGTGPASGPVRVQNRSAREPALNRQNRSKTGQKPVKNRWTGRSIRFSGSACLKNNNIITSQNDVVSHIIFVLFFFKRNWNGLCNQNHKNKETNPRHLFLTFSFTQKQKFWIYSEIWERRNVLLPTHINQNINFLPVSFIMLYSFVEWRLSLVKKLE